MGGTEETADGGGRSEGQHEEGLRGLREATRYGHNFQISGAGNDGGGWQLAGADGKLGKGAEELVKASKDLEQGRGGQEGVGELI